MPSPPALSYEDYDAIASAVMETERGRWFLLEYARRNRSADTAAVLEALAAVETRLSARSVPDDGARQAGVEEAARRVAGALDFAARARARLGGATDAAATERALGDLGGMESDLNAALQALGAPHAAELKALAAPPLAPEPPEPAVAEEPETPRETQAEPVRLAEAPKLEPKRDFTTEPKSEAATKPVPTPELVASPPPQRFESRIETPAFVAVVTGERADAIAFARPQPTPKTPLLDRLSEAEKAILFA